MNDVVGGTSVSGRVLAAEFKQMSGLQIREIDSRPFSPGLLGNAFSGVSVALKLSRGLIWGDAVLFQASVGAMRSFGPVVTILGGLFRVPRILRVYGGSLDLLVEQSAFTRSVFGWLFKHNLVLLQSQGLVSFAKSQFPGSRVVWLPTHRAPMSRVANDIFHHEATSSVCRFAFFGRVTASKGIDVLLEAALRAREDWTIDLYGSLDPDEPISERIADVGDRIRYLGTIRHEDVAHRLKAYSALVLPTRFAGEGYPGVIIESFMAGVPVIASDWRFIPEIVIHDENGLLVNPLSVEQWVETLDAFSRCPSMSRRLAQGAANSAPGFYARRWAEEIVETVQNLIQAR